MRLFWTIPIMLLCLGQLSQADDRLVNGDFELAGAAGTTNYGPMWSGTGTLEVFGPAWYQGVSPFSGSKAVGIAAENQNRSGRVTQGMAVPSAGQYTITTSGMVWLFTGNGNPYEQSDVTFRVLVDGQLVRCATLRSNATAWNGQWTPLQIQFTTQVNAAVVVEVLCQANGGSGGGYAVSAIDNLSVDISPPATPRPNLLSNSGFESAGAVGTNNPGPNWIATGPMQVFGREWLGPGDCPASPFSGEKAMGITGNGRLTGTLGQFKIMTPGTYTLNLKGHLWQWTVVTNTSDSCRSKVEMIVDGNVVVSKEYTVYFDIPQNLWMPVEFFWTGFVNQYVSVVITGEIFAQGGPNSRGTVATDEWTLSTVDNTAPSTPIVTDDGATTGVNTQLHATWSASDPQSGIVNYEYSIGTSPGLTNVAAWTSVGTGTEVTRHGLNLPQGISYYFNVRAKNNFGFVSGTGSSNGIQVVSPVIVNTIGEAKAFPDGTHVKLSDKTISRRVGYDYWIQETNRSSGIRVKSALNYNAFPNTRHQFTGTLATVNGERYLNNVAYVTSGLQGFPKSVSLQTDQLGGQAMNAYTPGVEGGIGLNNIGLMTTVFGRITKIGPDYYYIDDGAELSDGTTTSGVANVGLRVMGSPSPRVVGDLVKVTGVSSTFLNPANKVQRALKAPSTPTKLN